MQLRLDEGDSRFVWPESYEWTVEIMATELPTSAKRGRGLVKAVSTVLESVGILNKGSANSPATPSAASAAVTSGISTNSLNVTRVAGLAALVTAIGAAALAVFNVDKSKDPAVVVSTAYVSVGAIIVASLFASAIIISADIRARVVAENAYVKAGARTEAPEFVKAWKEQLSVLKGVLGRLRNGTQNVRAAWLDASATAGPISTLAPDPTQSALQAKLSVGHKQILALLEDLLTEADPAATKRKLTEVQELADLMESALT
jgi:hypothetical protein